MIRIDPENREKRVAIIIVSYNTNEQVDELVESLEETTECPADIIVVNNGSDQVEPSQYTGIHLNRNILAPGSLHMGLAYADSISALENFEYYAYCFVTASSKLVNDDDIVSKLMNRLDETTVGVHPSLTQDTEIYWDYMKNDGSDEVKPVKMIGNIFGCYRADWFNSIGRFNRKLSYGYGLDIETGYLARKGGHQVCIDHSVQVKKVPIPEPNIEKIAYQQMVEYFTETYGSNYNEVLDEGFVEKSDEETV